jgi:hypothetical protein
MYMIDEGKLNLLIKQKRVFLGQATKDYSAGGNDMLDDVETALAEAKVELSQQLEVASCLRDEGEETWQKECNTILTNWFYKWFGKP